MAGIFQVWVKELWKSTLPPVETSGPIKSGCIRNLFQPLGNMVAKETLIASLFISGKFALVMKQVCFLNILQYNM